jgi:hypothetical protein
VEGPLSVGGAKGLLPVKGAPGCPPCGRVFDSIPDQSGMDSSIQHASDTNLSGQWLQCQANGSSDTTRHQRAAHALSLAPAHSPPPWRVAAPPADEVGDTALHLASKCGRGRVFDSIPDQSGIETISDSVPRASDTTLPGQWLQCQANGSSDTTPDQEGGASREKGGERREEREGRGEEGHASDTAPNQSLSLAPAPSVAPWRDPGHVPPPAPPPADEAGDTPLHVASQAGYADAVRAMVQRGEPRSDGARRAGPCLVDARNLQVMPLAEMWSGSEDGSYFRLEGVCITQP